MSNADLDPSRTAKGKLSVFNILLIEEDRASRWVCWDSDGEEQKVWRNLNLLLEVPWNESTWSFSVTYSPVLLTRRDVYPHLVVMKADTVGTKKSKQILKHSYWLRNFWLASKSILEATSDEWNMSDMIACHISHVICVKIKHKYLSRTAFHGNPNNVFWVGFA